MSSARKSFLGFLGFFPIALLSAAACGGSAFDNRAGVAGSNGMAGSNGVAGSNSAGSGGSSTGSGGNSAGATHAGAGTGPGHAGSAAGGAASGGLDLSACTSNSPCEVVPISCCGCGTGPISNFTAINAAYEMQFSARCAAVDCAPCGPMPSPPLDDPRLYLVATCQRPADAQPYRRAMRRAGFARDRCNAGRCGIEISPCPPAHPCP